MYGMFTVRGRCQVCSEFNTWLKITSTSDTNPVPVLQCSRCQGRFRPSREFAMRIHREALKVAYELFRFDIYC